MSSDNSSILPAELEDDKGISEDSAYLIENKLKDMDVNLIWDGYWRIRFVAGGAFGRKTDENIYPNLQRGVIFTQEPDLTLSLWLNKRWFIETVFQGSFDRSSYRGVYVGQEDEFVQEVVAGNSDVSATAYAKMEVPSPHTNAPGISAKFLTPKSKHEILLRFDPSAPRKKLFQGQYEINVQNIDLMEFIEGRFFILPDKDISNLAVYLEDREGSISGIDGISTERRYRLAQDTEYFVDEQNGLLELSSSHDGQVVVYYENSNGQPVGRETISDFIIKPDSNLRPRWKPQMSSSDYAEFGFDKVDVYDPDGRKFEKTSKVNISGKNYLVIYEPGKFTPFERQNVYSSKIPLPEESWRIAPKLRDRGALYPTESIDFSFIPSIQKKSITVYDSTNSSGDVRHPANRYPFAVSDPQAYGPGRESDPAGFSKTIVLTIRKKNSDYYLGTGVIPGSVVVHINGIRDENVKISKDGRISFSRFIHLDDWIEVSFRIEGSKFADGDLFIYQGNKFQLAPRLTLELAESMRWNISRERSVSEYEESPGSIKIASALDWKMDNAGINLKGDATLSTPDTTGKLRILDMEDGSLNLLFFESTLVQAPEGIPKHEKLTLNTRENADRYNYFSFDSLGREKLNDYLWNKATSTGKDGPALAASRSGETVGSRVMDLRFDLPEVANHWSAGDFLADSGGPINLSSYTGIEIPIMFREDYGSGDGLGASVPDILLQIGEIGETEDHHEDGVVNKADSGRMIEWNLTDYAETSKDIKEAWISKNIWRTLRITLNASQRAKLDSVRALRLVITNTPSNTAAPKDALDLNGRVILAPPRFNGSPFRVEVRNASDELVSNQHVSAIEIANNTLESAFPEVSSLFEQKGVENKVVKLSWGEDAPEGAPIGASERWEAVAWFSGIPLEAYRTLVFFVYDDNKSGSRTINVRITDEKGLGIKIKWTSSEVGKWDRIKVDIAKGKASSALGNSIEKLTIDKNAGELTRIILSGNNQSGGENSGTIYFDEFYLSDPSFSIAGKADLNAYWRYEENVATIGNFPILGDIALDGSFDISGGRIISSVNRENVVYSGSMRIRADILGMELDTDWQGAWNPKKLNWSGSHTLIIPSDYDVFWFKDAYSKGESGEILSFSRLNDLNLKLDFGWMRVFSEAFYDNKSIVQSWGTETAWETKRWNFDLDIRYILDSREFEAKSENYFSSWIKNYTLLWPARGDSFNREIHHALDLNANIEAFSVKWNPELRMKAYKAPKWNQENRWAGTLSFPIQFPTWSITPSYRRNFRQLIDTNMNYNANYGDVWHNFVSNVRNQLPLLTYLPFRELFGKKEGRVFKRVSKGLLEADYTAEFSLDIRRIVGSSFTDLFIPNYTNFSIERKYLRKGDTTGWEDEWRGIMGFEAINLFGRFGTYPIISIYNSEQLSNLLQIVLKDINSSSAPRPHEILWQSNWLFKEDRGKSFIFDHRMHWDYRRRDTRQDAKLEYRWRTAAKDVLRLPFFKRMILKQHYLENRELLLLKGSYPWQNAPYSTDFNMAVTIRHESAWIFPEVGEFKGWLTLGLGSFGEKFSNGWELGIEAELHF